MLRQLAPDSTSALSHAFASPPSEARPWIEWRWETTDTALLENQLLRFHHEEGGPLLIVTAAHDGAAFGQPDWLEAFRQIASLAATLEQPLWVQVPAFHSPHLTASLCGERQRYRARVLKADYWETRPGKWRKRRFETPVIFAIAAPLQRQRHLTLAQALDVTRALNRFETPRGLSASIAYRVVAFSVAQTSTADCLVSECLDAYIHTVPN